MGVAEIVERSAPSAAGSGWRWAAYAWATVIALGFGYFVVRIPVQVTDCLANLIQVQDQTWFQSLTAGVGTGYMRPMLWAQIKAMFELANGHYTAVFRGIHLLQVLACAGLFVAALRVRDLASAIVVPFGIAMLFGAHTLDGAVREAFPINSFLSVVVACLAAITLSLGNHSRWRDAAALLVFLAMLLTVESGVLVWVCLVAAWFAGARGVSNRAVLLSTACLAAYVVARFVFLDVGTPDLLERPSGFGFRALEPQELKARFGSWPLPFYAYNVLCQISTVLFSEPRTGVWNFVRSYVNDQVRVGQTIAVCTSVAASGLIAAYAASQVGRWRRREFDDSDRIVIVFLAVLVANAAVSFPYTKDVIVSPAGALHALAAAAALRHLLRRLVTARLPVVAAASLLIAAVASGSAVRLIGMCYTLRDASFVTRNDWTEVDDWARRNGIDLSPPRRAVLMRTLRDDAIARRVPAPAFADPDWARYFY